MPLRPLALNRALGVWNDLANEGLNVTDIVIVGYDSNGLFFFNCLVLRRLERVTYAGSSIIWQKISKNHKNCRSYYVIFSLSFYIL